MSIIRCRDCEKLVDSDVEDVYYVSEFDHLCGDCNEKKGDSK